MRRRLLGLVLQLGSMGAASCGRSGDHGTGDAGGVDAPAADGTMRDAAVACFPCDAQWICGGGDGGLYLTLEPEADGCHLSGLPGQVLISPSGTVTQDGAFVGNATGSGARVSVIDSDGGFWLFCAGGSGCPAVLP